MNLSNRKQTWKKGAQRIKEEFIAERNKFCTIYIIVTMVYPHTLKFKKMLIISRMFSYCEFKIMFYYISKNINLVFIIFINRIIIKMRAVSVYNEFTAFNFQSLIKHTLCNRRYIIIKYLHEKMFADIRINDGQELNIAA